MRRILEMPLPIIAEKLFRKAQELLDNPIVAIGFPNRNIGITESNSLILMSFV